MERLGKRRLGLSLTIAAFAGSILAAPVGAANTVSQTLNAGTRTASIANLTLGAKTYSHSNQTSTGTMTLTADDSTGSGNGWNVTVQSSAFVYSGTNSGTNIAASNFSITTANAPTVVAGQAIDTTATPPGGPKVPGTGATGALDVARKTVQAEVGYGQGTYDQGLAVSLTIPGGARAGTYTGTMTVTIAAAP